jgi:hypothetical protein
LSAAIAYRVASVCGGGIVVHSGMIAIAGPSANGRAQTVRGRAGQRRIEHTLVGGADFRLAPGK